MLASILALVFDILLGLKANSKTCLYLYPYVKCKIPCFGFVPCVVAQARLPLYSVDNEIGSVILLRASEDIKFRCKKVNMDPTEATARFRMRFLFKNDCLIFHVLRAVRLRCEVRKEMPASIHDGYGVLYDVCLVLVRSLIHDNDVCSIF